MNEIVKKEAGRIEGEGRSVSPMELRNGLQPLLRERALEAVDREVETFLTGEGGTKVEAAAEAKAAEWATKGAGAKQKEAMKKALAARLATVIRSRLTRKAREQVQSSLPSRIQPILMEAIRSHMRGGRRGPR